MMRTGIERNGLRGRQTVGAVHPMSQTALLRRSSHWAILGVQLMKRMSSARTLSLCPLGGARVRAG